jgi:hypothetical protein
MVVNAYPNYCNRYLGVGGRFRTHRHCKEDEYLMMMDPNNPVVKLCIAGMQAEGAGNHELASSLFVQAWNVAGDDYEACVAAHYLARHQPNLEETLRWNQESLRLDEAVGDDRVRDFVPSLLLNVGHSYEILGNTVEARRYYDLAAAGVETLLSDQYGKMVRNGIARGRQRVALPDQYRRGHYRNTAEVHRRAG